MTKRKYLLFCKKMYLGLISVLTEYDASKYALCTFFHFTMRYTGILRTLEILYMCARVFTFKTQQNNKKSFLLNDPHLRNGINRLQFCFSVTIWFLYTSCQRKLSRCLRVLLFSLFRTWPKVKGKRICQIQNI